MLSTFAVPVLFSQVIDSKQTELQTFFVSGTAMSAREASRLTGPERMDAMRSAGFAFAEGNLDPALGLAQTLPLDSDRIWLLEGIVASGSRAEATRTAAALERMPEGDERRDLGRILVSCWALKNAASAAEWVSKLPGGGTQDAAMTALISAWVVSDPDAAARWASNLAPAPESADVKPLPVLGMGGAMAILEARFNRGHALQVVGFEWAKRDKRRARAWAAGLPDAISESVLSVTGMAQGVPATR